MSSIGSSNPAAANLASSFAGAQRTSSQQDEAKTSQSAQKFQAAAAEALDKDVAEANLDADREADGRQGYVLDEHPPTEETQPDDEEGGSTPEPNQHAPDAFGERGTSLDLDA
jgi:hypothetical protein